MDIQPLCGLVSRYCQTPSAFLHAWFPQPWKPPVTTEDTVQKKAALKLADLWTMQPVANIALAAPAAAKPAADPDDSFLSQQLASNVGGPLEFFHDAQED